jgi:hypothetical protein
MVRNPMRLRIEPFSGPLGAAVFGMDFTIPIDPDAVDAVLEGLRRYLF